MGHQQSRPTYMREQRPARGRCKTDTIMTRQAMDPSCSGAAISALDVHALEQNLLYSQELGIELSRRRDAMYFRWFLARILLGGRISETITKNTYRAFIHHGLTTPRKILGAGWGFLVKSIMREGGYVRYDGRKQHCVEVECSCRGMFAWRCRKSADVASQSATATSAVPILRSTSTDTSAPCRRSIMSSRLLPTARERIVTSSRKSGSIGCRKLTFLLANCSSRPRHA